MIKQYKLRFYNFRLVIFLLAISTFGIILVGSAREDLRSKQLAGVIIGLIIMIILSLMDYSWISNFQWIMYGINIVLLLIVRLFGDSANGAARWIDFGFIRFQPTELSKIILILFFARFFMDHEEDLNTVRTLAKSVIILAIPLILIYEQPDLSTTIMVFILIAMILFVSGLSYRLVTGILVITVPSVIVFINMVTQEGSTLLNEYQRGRILAWLHPEDYASTLAYQTMNSIMAIGSGQLMGKGYNTNEISSVLNSGFISESQTDFIFTVIGEEFGFIGSSTVVILLMLIAIRCYFIARAAKDTAGTVIATGVGTWIGFQGFMNIAVATGILPNTGIPLPFVSYGLTSLLSLYIGVGFLLNVRMQSMQKTSKSEGIHFGGMT